jgi:hypothetical protein
MSYFTEIDIRKIRSIPVQGKSPKVVSFHPEDSYEIKSGTSGDYSQLEILEPENFWNGSRYLVIEVK